MIKLSKITKTYGQGPHAVLAGIDDFSLENTERIVHAWIEEKGYGMGQVMN